MVSIYQKLTETNKSNYENFLSIHIHIHTHTHTHTLWGRYIYKVETEALEKQMEIRN